MSHLGQPRSRVEEWTGAGILLCLVAVAGGVFLKQFSFNRAVLVARTDESAKPAQPKASVAPAWLPPELAELGPPEMFTPDDLYDKIDGKAELYLASGFVRLNCRRFALKGSTDQWLEWSVYDMGTVPQAFSVFTVQRRPDGQPLDLTDYAYQTRNALFFVCDSNYIEAVASTTNAPLMQAMLALARGYVAVNGGKSTPLAQLGLLPTGNLVADSCALQTSDAFGFDQFKNVFTAQYKVGGAEALAFVTTCPNAGAAEALRDAYRAFLLANGGKHVESQHAATADQPIEIMDTIEVVFSEGKYVAGVHAAPDLATAAALAVELHQRLAAKSK